MENGNGTARSRPGSLSDMAPSARLGDMKYLYIDLNISKESFAYSGRMARMAEMAEMAGIEFSERRRRPAPTGDAREILESWLPTGPADVWALLSDLTMLFVINGDWSPLALEATRLVSEATSAGWADHRLVEALREVLAADDRGELEELPDELAAQLAALESSNVG